MIRVRGQNKNLPIFYVFPYLFFWTNVFLILLNIVSARIYCLGCPFMWQHVYFSYEKNVNHKICQVAIRRPGILCVHTTLHLQHCCWEQAGNSTNARPLGQMGGYPVHSDPAFLARQWRDPLRRTHDLHHHRHPPPKALHTRPHTGPIGSIYIYIYSPA